ncbi:MAG: peptidylprolyl isomerase [Gemmatimonadetes bacterium]|nr:peptidylprolyl isomerase [Gemmatimonadota bacterium]
MKLIRSTTTAAMLAVLIALAPAIPAGTPVQSGEGAQPASGELAAQSLGPGTYAVFNTNMGVIICKLFDRLTPVTVDNFIGLAEGTRTFKDPRTGQETKRPYFDGTLFHRVIPNFMIQGGDPTGTGQGGPGYNIKGEIRGSLKFDRPGRLAMANAGSPDTAGSQFFITHGPKSYLDGGYTIFGQVMEGQEVVNAIGRVQTRGDRPIFNVVLEKLIIERVP